MGSTNSIELLSGNDKQLLQLQPKGKQHQISLLNSELTHQPIYQSTYFRYSCSSVSEENSIEKTVSGNKTESFTASLPLLQQGDYVIKVPNKVERVLRRYTRKE